jgi:hypothetical protein
MLTKIYKNFYSECKIKVLFANIESKGIYNINQVISFNISATTL